MGKQSDPMSQVIDAHDSVEVLLVVGRLQAENADLNRKLEEAQAQVCGMREMIPHLKLTTTNCDAIAFHLEEGEDNGGITRAALAAYLRDVAIQIRHYQETCSSSSSCSHEAEIKRLEARWSESVGMVTEIEGKYQEAQAQVCGMREALKAIASTEDGNFLKMRQWCEKHDLYIDDLSDERAWVTVAKKALSAFPPCLHEAALKAKEKVVEIAQELEILTRCQCDNAFTSRGRHEPNTLCEENLVLAQALADLEGKK